MPELRDDTTVFRADAMTLGLPVMGLIYLPGPGRPSRWARLRAWLLCRLAAFPPGRWI